MVEIESSPVYNNEELSGDRLYLVMAERAWQSGLGVRYYFTFWLSLGR